MHEKSADILLLSLSADRIKYFKRQPRCALGRLCLSRALNPAALRRLSGALFPLTRHRGEPFTYRWRCGNSCSRKRLPGCRRAYARGIWAGSRSKRERYSGTSRTARTDSTVVPARAGDLTVELLIILLRYSTRESSIFFVSSGSSSERWIIFSSLCEAEARQSASHRQERCILAWSISGRTE